MNLKILLLFFTFIAAGFPQSTLSDQSSELSFCTTGSTEGVSEFSLFEAFLRFPLSLADTFAAEETPQSACSQGDSNVFEYLLNEGATQTLWSIIAESISSSCDDTGLEIFTQEIHSNCRRVLDNLTNFLTNIDQELSTRVAKAMNAASQIWFTVTTWITSLPQAVIQFTQSTGSIADQLTKLTTSIKDLATEAWCTLLRYAVALLLGLSCITHMYKKDTRLCQRNEHTKKKKPHSQLIGNSVSSRAAAPEPPEVSHFPDQHASHYPMCEVFDQLPCNCGVKGRVNERNTTNDVLNHFKMCEYFDKLPCNCGGISASTNGDQAIDFDKEKIMSNEYVHCSVTAIPTCSGVKSKSLYDRRKKVSSGEQRKSLQKLYIVGQSPNRKMNSVEAETQESEDTFDPTVDGSGNATCNMDESIYSDIGDPVFNSSFKEDNVSEFHVSFHEEVSYISNTSFVSPGRDPLAAGDGVDSAILTRRSPFKEVGVSFNESSDAEQSESFYDATSFSDITGLNKSISFQDGDGLFELTMAFLVRNVFSWTMWFLRRRGMSFPAWKVHDITCTSGRNITNRLYLLLPGNRSKRRSIRSLPLSRNNSASVLTELTEDGLSVNEITHDTSLLNSETRHNRGFEKTNGAIQGSEINFVLQEQVPVELRENTVEPNTVNVNADIDVALTDNNKEIGDEGNQNENSTCGCINSYQEIEEKKISKDIFQDKPLKCEHILTSLQDSVECEADIAVLSDNLKSLSAETDNSVDIEEVSVEIGDAAEKPKIDLHKEDCPFDEDLSID